MTYAYMNERWKRDLYIAVKYKRVDNDEVLPLQDQTG